VHEYIVIGRDIEIQTGLGRIIRLGADYVLLTEARPKLGGPMELGQELPGRPAPTAKQSDAWREWSGGEVTEVRNVATFSDERGRADFGGIAKVWYTSDRMSRGEFKSTRYEHKFRRPYAELVETRKGLKIEARGSRHRVTKRGIVG